MGWSKVSLNWILRWLCAVNWLRFKQLPPFTSLYPPLRPNALGSPLPLALLQGQVLQQYQQQHQQHHHQQQRHNGWGVDRPCRQFQEKPYPHFSADKSFNDNDNNNNGWGVGWAVSSVSGKAPPPHFPEGKSFNNTTAGLTLRASLSGTFLQTLPDLVMPLKGHSLSPRRCPATRSSPSERFGY